MTPFVATPQSNSPPLMNMGAVQTMLPMGGLPPNPLQVAAIQAALQQKIINAVNHQGLVRLTC